MWLIENLENPEVTHHLLCGPSQKVGRRGNGNHITIADVTISSSHASFTLTHEERNLHSFSTLSKVYLTDLGSSNGTYLDRTNEKIRISSEVPEELCNGECIYFGNRSSWRLVHKPLIVTTSQISDRAVKSELKKDLLSLGGHMSKNWHENCTHLVMTDLILTPKTVCALASCIPIVIPKFLQDIIANIENKESVQDTKDYLPPLKEPSLNSSEVSFEPDQRRKRLFAQKTFFFLSEASFKRMKEAINIAVPLLNSPEGHEDILLEISYNIKDDVLPMRGECELLLEDSISRILSPNSICIKSPDQSSTLSPEANQALKETLKKNELSLIPESDIGLAIVYVSVEKFCNPRFLINGIIKPYSYTNSSQEQNLVIYATETQNELSSRSSPSQPLSRTTVPESGQSSKSKNGNSGRQTFAIPEPPSEKKSSDSENKENLRKRSRSNESIGGSKRLALSPNRHSNTSTLADTEIMQDDVKQEVDDIVDFAPSVSSTEKESPDRVKGGAIQQSEFNKGPQLPKGCRASPRRNNLRVVQGGKSELVPSAATSSGASSVLKSIPFEPYSLPSLTMNPPGEPTITLEPSMDIEQAPLDSSLEPVRVKREPDEESDCGSERTVNFSLENFRAENWVQTGPNANVGSSKSRPEPDKNQPDPEPPSQGLSTSRTRRRGRLMLEEPSENLRPVRKKIKEEPLPSSLPNLSTDESGIEPPHGQAGMVKRSPSDAEAPSTSEMGDIEIPVKKEDVASIAERLERTLIVVEVVSLVKKLNVSTEVNESSFTSLPNFKKFKKVLPHSQRVGDSTLDAGSTSLPKIIGGDDLIAHSQVNTRRDEFLQSQSNLLSNFDRREKERTMNEEPDPEFDSNFSIKSKKRGRIR